MNLLDLVKKDWRDKLDGKTAEPNVQAAPIVVDPPKVEPRLLTPEIQQRTYEQEHADLLTQLDGATKVIAALVIGYANGEARITEAFLQGVNTAKVTTHTEPDGTLAIRVTR